MELTRRQALWLPLCFVAKPAQARTNVPMTFEEAIGRIFSFHHKRLYVVRGLKNPYRAIVVDLETSTEELIYESALHYKIPSEWKEILPQ